MDTPPRSLLRWNLPPRDVRETACGTLRVERLVGEWAGGGPGRWGPDGRLGRWSLLIDTADYRTLLDTAPFETSEFRFLDDGRLLLWLREGSSEAMFRIDPAARTFRSLAFAEAGRPLVELADAAHAEYRRMWLRKPDGLPAFPRGKPDWLERRFTRKGTVRLDLYAWRIHDMEDFTPRLVLTDADETILDLNPDWDCRPNLYSEELIYLDLQRADFRTRLIVRPHERTGQVEGAGEARLPLDALKRLIEERFEASRAAG